MATIAENLKTIKDSTMAIKQAIIDKGGEVGDLTTYASAILNLPSGGGDVNPTAEKNAVTFYDYDGTIRYSYTAEEFLALTEMPPLPRQQGLICQEWNWSYEDAREYVTEYGVLDVGATYITDDGKTRLYIRIAAEGRMDVPLYFQQTIANGVTIDWGDGSATETLDGTGKVNTTHRYASIGDYMISLDVAEGCTLNLGHNVSGYCVMGSTDNDGKIYRNMLQKVEIGTRLPYLKGYQFSGCSLTSIALPNSVKMEGSNIFASSKIKSIVLPNTLILGSSLFNGCSNLFFVVMSAKTSFSNQFFYNASSISSLILPSINFDVSSVLYGCSSLPSIVIPESTTAIGSSTFGNCYSLSCIDFSHHTSIPTLAKTNAFTGIPSDCKIIVPDALYDEWVAATNWSTYASYIIKKSDWDNL